MEREKEKETNREKKYEKEEKKVLKVGQPAKTTATMSSGCDWRH